ncbi:MAG: tetratricopeptide repeat protein [Bacteroidota bacterium]
MLLKKKKISKKEIKHDALVDTYFSTRAWYSENKKQVSTYGTIALVIVLGLWFYSNNVKSNNNEATTDLGKIYSFYDNGQFEIAKNGIPGQNISGLESIVENYGSTKSGNMAKLYLANIELQSNNTDKAMELFEDFSSDDDLMNASAFAGVAACYEVKKEFANSAKYFEKAANSSTVDQSRAEYLSLAAQSFSQVGEKEKAKEIFKQIKSEYSSSNAARDADRFISELSID